MSVRPSKHANPIYVWDRKDTGMHKHPKMRESLLNSLDWFSETTTGR